jgi:hypothetical protein
LFVVALTAVACSTGGSESTAPPSTGDSADSPARDAVDVSDVKIERPPAGNGVAHLAVAGTGTAEDGSVSLPEGYVEEEFLLSGVATTYDGPATGPVTSTGEEYPYVTRVLVRYPEDPADFSGRVLLEPFNTSGGVDADVLWRILSSVLVESGDAWVGVSVRSAFVVRLTDFDAVRYGGLDIPLNDVEWDLLRQLGRVLKDGTDQSPLPDLTVDSLYLGGYSQSAVDTATFAGAFNPITGAGDGSPVFDGYFPAAHSASLTTLQSGTTPIPDFEYAPMPAVDVPVLDIETQTDVEGFETSAFGETYVSSGGATVRRDDADDPDDRFRLYEIAGAPHANWIPGCEGQESTFPTRFFVRAAFVRLTEWAEEGVEPPRADRIELDVEGPVSVARTDDVGNAFGGVRSPFLDSPVARYDVHTTPPPICPLSGSEAPLERQVLVDRYGSVDHYVTQFRVQLDEAIELGFLRPEDREALLEFGRTQAEQRFGS